MHVTAALLYVIAVVIKISTVVGFLAPAAPLFDHSAASRLFDRHAQLTHVSARSGPLHKMATSRNNAVIAAPPLAATRRGGMDDGDNVERKSEGIEPKYLAAIGVVVLAALYDLFVTHQGRLWEL